MSAISRRQAIRRSGLALAVPFASTYLSKPVFGESASGSTVDAGQLTQSTAAALNSPHFLSYIVDRSAKGVASSHLGQVPDYASLSVQCRMMARYFQDAGIDPVVKKYAGDMLASSTYPAIDPQWQAGATAKVQKYAPSFTLHHLAEKSLYPNTPADWASSLTTLRDKGMVACCHDAADQLYHMSIIATSPGSPAAQVSYHALTTGHDGHLMDVKCMWKFFLCLGAVVALGAAAIALVLVVCGTTGLIACLGGTVWAAAAIAEFGLVTGALMTACGAFLASDHEQRQTFALKLA